MTLDDAINKGFLTLSEDDASDLLDSLYDIEDPQEQFDKCMALLKTVVEESKIPSLVDLVAIVLQASDEIYGDEEFEDEDEDEHHH